MEDVQDHLEALEIAPMNEGLVHNNYDNSNGIDRISNLPNDVICHILSFLPTKYAVGTSILSTKWKNLVPLIPNMRIQLNESSFLHPGPASETNLINFGNFVDKFLNVTLQSLPYVPSISHFSLQCRRCNNGQVIGGWITAALLLNVKEITLRIFTLRNSNFLLDSLFGCNITELNLSIGFHDNISEYRFSLPNLKTLVAQYLKCAAVNALQEGCPSLNYLTLYHCYCLHGEVLCVSIPSLIYLKISTGSNSQDGEFIVDVPKLESFHYEGLIPHRFQVKRFKFLDRADLNLYANVDWYDTHVLIEACSTVKKLRVSEKVIRDMLFYYPLLPPFRRMTHLVISNMERVKWKLIPFLLDSIPNIKHFSSESGFNNEGYEMLKASLKKPGWIRLTQCGHTGFDLEFCRNAEN